VGIAHRIRSFLSAFPPGLAFKSGALKFRCRERTAPHGTIYFDPWSLKSDPLWLAF